MTPFEIAGTLLACLETVYTDEAGTPAQFCHRPGAEALLDFGVGKDDCCNGLGWVRIAEIAPVIDPLDAEQPDFNPCDLTARRTTIELGVARCNPATATCETWAQLAAQLDIDARHMRQAVCCLDAEIVGGSVYRVLPGTWTPMDSSGGCAGGSMPVTVWIDCEEEC